MYGLAALVLAVMGIGAALLVAGVNDSSNTAGASGTSTSVSPSPLGATDGAQLVTLGQAATTAHTHDTTPAAVVGDSPCEKSGAPLSEGQTADGHGTRGLIKQATLTQDERAQLAIQQDQARTVAIKYPTVKEAEAAGYIRSTGFVPCIGAHYTNALLAAKFDFAAPSELLYDGTTPDAKIVGLSYLVWHPGGAPEGFAGSNDHWHQHNVNGGLCLKGGLGVIGGESMDQKTCEGLGGKKTILKDIWMLHDWTVPGWECTWGTFSGECPELGGVAGKSAWAKG